MMPDDFESRWRRIVCSTVSKAANRSRMATRVCFQLAGITMQLQDQSVKQPQEVRKHNKTRRDIVLYNLIASVKSVVVTIHQLRTTSYATSNTDRKNPGDNE